MTWRAPIPLLVVLGGCAGLGAGDAFDPLPFASVPAAGADAGELGVEIGTGTAQFVALHDGDPVDVVLGPQGGYHVWTSVRVDEPDAHVARIALAVRFEDGRPAGAPSETIVPLTAAGPFSEHTGMTSFVTDPASVRGVRVVLRADVTIPSGRHGSAERAVIPR